MAEAGVAVCDAGGVTPDEMRHTLLWSFPIRALNVLGGHQGRIGVRGTDLAGERASGRDQRHLRQPA